MTPKSGETLVEGVEGPSRWDCSYIFAGSSREQPMSSENFNWSSTPTEMGAEN